MALFRRFFGIKDLGYIFFPLSNCLNIEKGLKKKMIKSFDFSSPFKLLHFEVYV